MKNKMVPWKKRGEAAARGRDAYSFDLLHREIDDLFDAYFGWRSGNGRRETGSAGWELSETDDEIRVKAELPGMKENDIEVMLDENTLIIRGERREQTEKNKRNYHVSEMSYGSFHRSIPLPAEVDAAKASARFKRGVLTLSFPKTEPAKRERKRITVSAD